MTDKNVGKVSAGQAGGEHSNAVQDEVRVIYSRPEKNVVLDQHRLYRKSDSTKPLRDESSSRLTGEPANDVHKDAPEPAEASRVKAASKIDETAVDKPKNAFKSKSESSDLIAGKETDSSRRDSLVDYYAYMELGENKLIYSTRPWVGTRIATMAPLAGMMASTKNMRPCGALTTIMASYTMAYDGLNFCAAETPLDRLKYGSGMAADSLMLSGGVLATLGKAPKVGPALIAAGLMSRLAVDFIPNEIQPLK